MRRPRRRIRAALHRDVWRIEGVVYFMRFIIADIPGVEVRRLYPGDDNYILAEDECDVHPCIGCMKCWIRDLPECVIRDDFSGMVGKFRTCSELVILSKCVYGGFSPYVKNAVDRLFPVFLQNLEIRDGNTAFRSDIESPFAMTVCLYDARDKNEEHTAEDYARRLAASFEASGISVAFFENVTMMEGGDE